MFGFLAAMSKPAKWSDDPNQRRLALMIFDAAIYASSEQGRGKPLDLDAILALTRDSGWSERESADRFVHANRLKNTNCIACFSADLCLRCAAWTGPRY